MYGIPEKDKDFETKLFKVTYPKNYSRGYDGNKAESKLFEHDIFQSLHIYLHNWAEADRNLIQVEQI